MKTSFRHAFTLIELLVVISIIAVVAGILFPVYGNVQLAGQRTQSLTNMRQLGGAFTGYCGDNNGSVPPQGDATSWSAAAQNTSAEMGQWYNALPRAYANCPNLSEYATNPAAFYAKGSLFYVPAAKYPTNKLSAPQFAVVYNSKLLAGVYSNVRLQMFKYPAETVTFLEQGIVGEKTVQTSQKAYANPSQAYAYASRAVARYNGMMILTFADGHSETVTGTNVVAPDGKAYWPPLPNASYYWTEDPSYNPGN